MSSTMAPQTAVGPVDAPSGSRLFRGRSLEELLPRIREALGEDAIVLRQREGLSGGVGGFFQKRFVEMEAVAGVARAFDAYDDEPAFPPAVAPAADRPEMRAPDEASAPDLPPRSPAAAPEAPAAPVQATAELDGLAFLRHLDEALQRRTAQDRAEAAATGASSADEPLVPVAAAGPRVAAPQRPPEPAPAVSPWMPQRASVREEVADVAAAPADPDVTLEPEAAEEDRPVVVATPSPVPVCEPRPRPSGTPTPPVPAATPAVDVDIVEHGLVARGLAPGIARPLVREAAAGGAPLAAAARAALTDRVSTLPDGDDVRTLAIVGGPGSGRTSAVGALCRAYAGDGRSVLVVALRPADDGAALRAAVAGTEATVIVAASGGEAAEARRATEADVCLLDTPVVDRGRAELVAALAADLRVAGADEVHLAVSGTDTAGGVTATIDAFGELGVDALLMTHRDLADRPGGIISGAILRRLPVSYVTDGRGLALATPAGLARMVQP